MKKINMLSFFLVLWLIPALGFAHVGMLNSSPAKNGIVSSPPEKVTIKMSGEVEKVFSKVEVFDQDGKKVSKKTKFSKDNMVMETKLKRGKMHPGIYTVKWKCMSLDGHTLTGEYTFTIE